jgi:hypothetical protein
LPTSDVDIVVFWLLGIKLIQFFSAVFGGSAVFAGAAQAAPAPARTDWRCKAEVVYTAAIRVFRLCV